MESVRDDAPGTGEVLAGLLLSLLVPLVGFLVGGVWLARGGRAVAAGTVATALALGALGFWLGFTFR
jgi:hypothetical protein